MIERAGFSAVQKKIIKNTHTQKKCKGILKQQTWKGEEWSAAPGGSFICTCVYLYGNVQDELESQNTLLLAENILLTALFFFALGGFHRPSMRSTIILSFVFHLPRVEVCRAAFQVWQVPLLLFSFSCFLSRPALLASCGFGQPVSERHLGRIGPMN